MKTLTECLMNESGQNTIKLSIYDHYALYLDIMINYFNDNSEIINDAIKKYADKFGNDLNELKEVIDKCNLNKLSTEINKKLNY